jgi:CubicO group peptidase (beta-lactamase class C family)
MAKVPELKAIFLLSISIFLVTAGCDQRPDIELSRTNREIDEVFQEWDRSDSPGCALAVVREGEIIYERGYGMADLEHGIPIGPDSVFYAGSVSKQFVALTLLLLEEQGRLSLDDNIRKYLPEFPDYGAPIKIRHLIHHTSGLRDYLDLWLLSGRDYLDRVPVHAAYELIRRQEHLNFPPGEKHLYSNSCYFLIPLIVERVVGEPFKSFAAKNIFGPLGMENSHFHDDVTHLIQDRAFAYRKNANGSFGSLLMRFDLVGSGGLYTTVTDLAKWDANFYANRLGRKDPELIDKMLTNGRLNDGAELDYACALVNGNYRGLRTVGHSGALGGYRAQFTQFPDQRFSVIILSNLESFEPAKLALRVAEIYLGAQMTEEVEMEVEEAASEPEGPSTYPVPALSGQELLAYAGEFYSRELRTWYAFSVGEGTLMVRLGEQVERSLVVKAEDRFAFDGFQIQFGRNTVGQVTGFTISSEGVENLEFRKQLRLGGISSER